MENDSWKQDRSGGKGPDSMEAGAEHTSALETEPGVGNEHTGSSESRNLEENGAREAAAEKPLTEPVPYMEFFYSERENGDHPQEPTMEEKVSTSRSLVDEESAGPKPDEPQGEIDTALAEDHEEECEPEAVDLPELWMKHMESEPDPEPEEEPMNDEELSRVIEEICRSKAEEFRMIGYEQVIGEEIWECVSDKYRKTGVPPLHRIVNDILSLKATQFMNWMTMSIYKDAHR
ncbi:Post-transcriptional regulator [Paenibacillus tianmuensis]|uniref:Post-transcriptional regulator n=1 Tax=Paenibacillus tianmuensis TaxID=624147 RepID=A0A1G4QMM1_9BACL|nr:Post-transcriptional regulator [Paenibacillus tianmuensis]